MDLFSAANIFLTLRDDLTLSASGKRLFKRFFKLFYISGGKKIAGTLKYFFETSSQKGMFWQNKKKFDFSALICDSRNILAASLKCLLTVQNPKRSPDSRCQVLFGVCQIGCLVSQILGKYWGLCRKKIPPRVGKYKNFEVNI